MVQFNLHETLITALTYVKTTQAHPLKQSLIPILEAKVEIGIFCFPFGRIKCQKNSFLKEFPNVSKSKKIGSIKKKCQIVLPILARKLLLLAQQIVFRRMKKGL